MFNKVSRRGFLLINKKTCSFSLILQVFLCKKVKMLITFLFSYKKNSKFVV